VYCDGRSERYQVADAFGDQVDVKTNALAILRKELHSMGRRANLEPSFIMVGGGVGDSYQPVETQYQLTRRVLKLLAEYQWPVHILTKSTLVERDLEIIKQIHQQNRAIVSFSFSSTNDEVSAIFEPKVPSPSERLKTLKFFKKQGIPCGMFFLPVIPFITDTPEMIAETLQTAHNVGVDFVIFGGMTLKHGRQQAYFYRSLNKNYPTLVAQYESIYGENQWGQANQKYYRIINSIFHEMSRKYKVTRRIPPALFKDIISENDLVIVMLEHLDYFLQLEGKRSSYGYAAHQISKITQPLSTMKSALKEIKGVGYKTEQIILEILETKNSDYYNSLM
jgi:DNA repair photolyase